MLGIGPLTILTLLGLITSLLPLHQAPAPTIVPVTTPLIEGVVIRVIDGNSLELRIEGRRTAVGYLGVDAPQLNAPCGAEAFARNQELVGSRVLLEEDTAYQFDEIGRRLYNVFNEDGRSIEETLVREGLARAVRTDARNGATLASLEASAKASNEGCIWSWAPGP